MKATSSYNSGHLQDALSYVKQASELDHKFAWVSLNSMAFIRLALNGSGITEYNQVEEARKVTQELFYDLSTVQANIANYILPRQEALCTSLQAVRKAEPSATYKQCAITLAFYKQEIAEIQAVIKQVQDLGPDKMVRIKNTYGAERIIEKIELQIYNETSQEGIKELKFRSQKHAPEAMKHISEILKNEIDLLGYVGFEIEVYDLKKDYSGTVWAFVVASVQLFIGIVVYPFAPQYMSTLISQAFSNFVEIYQSIHNGKPIDFWEFSKRNALTFGISSAITSASNLIKGVDIFTGRSVSEAANPIFMDSVVDWGKNQLSDWTFTNIANLTLGIAEITDRKEPMKDDAKKAMDAVFSQKSEQIKGLLVSCTFKELSLGGSMLKCQDEFLEKITNIVIIYAKNDMWLHAIYGVGKGVGGGVINDYISGNQGGWQGMYGRLGSWCFTAFADLITGGVKVHNSKGVIINGLSSYIDGEDRMNSNQLMHAKLKQSFPENADAMMKDIEQDLCNGEVCYNDCKRYEKLDKQYNKSITKDCQYIGSIINQIPNISDVLRQQAEKKATQSLDMLYTSTVIDSMKNALKELLQIPIEQIWTDAELNKSLNQHYKWDKKERKFKCIDCKDKGHDQDKPNGTGSQGSAQSNDEKKGEGKNNDQQQDDQNNKQGAKTSTDKQQENVTIKKGDTVHDILSASGKKPTNKDYEEFLKNNPYYNTQSRVTRDEKGNIININLRPGETIKVAREIAVNYEKQRAENVGSDKSSKQSQAGGAKVSDKSDTINPEQTADPETLYNNAITEWNSLSKEKEQEIQNSLKTSKEGWYDKIRNAFNELFGAPEANATPAAILNIMRSMPAALKCLESSACRNQILNTGKIIGKEALSLMKSFYKEAGKHIDALFHKENCDSSQTSKSSSTGPHGSPDPDDDHRTQAEKTKEFTGNKIDLDKHEASANQGGIGHTKEKHVNPSQEYIAQRAEKVRVSKNPTESYSFYPDEATTEQAINDVKRMKADEIQKWANNLNFKETETFSVQDLGRQTGYGISKQNLNPSSKYGAKIVLRKMPNGSIQLVTSYPE